MFSVRVSIPYFLDQVYTSGDLDTKTACGKRKKLKGLLPGNVKIGTNSFFLTDKKYIKNV